MTTEPNDDGRLTSIGVSAGNLLLSREACERYLPGIESIALLNRSGEVMVVPLTRESGGGLLLNIRNLRGDRVIHAQEFFRVNGFSEDFTPRRVAMRWDEHVAALVLTGIATADRRDAN